MQATSTSIRQGQWAQRQAETEAAAEVAARLDAIETGGKNVQHAGLDKDVEAKGEKFFVSVLQDGGELALTFTSYTRIKKDCGTARQVEQIIDGRTTHSAVSHSRRALVTSAGHIFIEVDGRLALTANKYERATKEMISRLTALGLWTPDRTAYTSNRAFAQAV